MTTSGPAAQLFTLQQTDSAVNAARLEVARLEKELADGSALARARAAHRAETQTEHDLKSKQRELELEAAGISAKIKEVEGQLYGGKVANSKELANLQHEIDLLKKRLKGVDDGDLEVMEGLEKTGLALKKTAAALTSTEAAHGERQTTLTAALKSQRKALAALGETRTGLADSVPKQTLSRYERLRQGKGTGVAVVEQGICQGCRIALFAAQLREVRAGNLVPCDNCGRFLYLA